jgi:hypothetical protein
MRLFNLELPVIKCFCGAEILLLPNVKVMGEAIEAHAKEHIKKGMTRREAMAEVERVREDLIVQVLQKASDL